MAITYLYLDDSGTRNPDFEPKGPPEKRDAFCLGGVLINEEDREGAEAAHTAFCGRWNIAYPLHSSEIRHREDNFYWLRKLSEADFNRFMSDLTNMLVSVPVIGHACVVDRPGYDARYRAEYGRRTWHLCKTAFSVIVERAAKIAIRNERRLVVYPEWSDAGANKRLKRYFKELKSEGMPFAAATSAKYSPLTQQQLNHTLIDFAFKPKTSRLIQIADLYLYPMRRGGYDLAYRPLDDLKANDKIIDCLLSPEDIVHLGVKYSCFEHVTKS
jgi:hypothetical protein